MHELAVMVLYTGSVLLHAYGRYNFSRGLALLNNCSSCHSQLSSIQSDPGAQSFRHDCIAFYCMSCAVS